MTKQDSYDNILDIVLKGNYNKLANEFNNYFIIFFYK